MRVGNRVGGCAVAVVLSALLAGCATTVLGTVIGSSAPDPSQAALLTAPEDDTFWVQPPPADRHSAVWPTPIPVPRTGLWVTEGRFLIRFLCYTPKDGVPARDAYPIIPNTRDQRGIEVHAGHKYLLRCSDRKIGVFNLVEMNRKHEE